MASYYRKFVSKFSELVAPLTTLTKKNTSFVWNAEHDDSFTNIKNALSNTPILCYPDFDKSFKLHTDASDTAVGAMLTQFDDVERPIGYYSRKLNSAEQNYTTTEKEALAIVSAVKHFSYYLYGRKFQILTDHAPLRYIFQYKSTIPRITRWTLLLAQFDYEITYRPGKENVIPDSLSRNVASIQAATKHNDNFNPAMIFDPVTIRSAQNKQSDFHDIIECLENNNVNRINPKLLDNYTMRENCLYYVQHATDSEDDIPLRLVVPKSMKREALILSHDSALGGHYGVKKSLHRSRQMFYWPNQATDVSLHVSKCRFCQCRNLQGVTQAKIQQLPVVSRPLERVGIDLIGKLSPSYSGKQYILTIVCHFTRFVQAYALPDKQSNTVTKAFLDYVCRYGNPECIVSDRGSEFTASTFKEVLDMLQIKLHLTTSFHPQSNGLTEAFNKLLKNTLCSMVQSDVKTWDEQLPCTVLALNCSYHPSIRNVPYYLFHGRDPPLHYSSLLNRNVLNYALNDDSPSCVFARLQKAFKEAQLASQNAHDKNVKYRKVKNCNFAIGDVVFLKNDSKARSAYSKFLPNWQGPYRITNIFNNVNAEIKPLFDKKKKLTVHFNRLKLAKMSEDEPYVCDDPSTNVNPDKDKCTEKVETNSDDEDDNVIIIRKPKPFRYALRSLGPPPDVNT